MVNWTLRKCGLRLRGRSIGFMARRRRRASGARKLLIVVLASVCLVALILYLTKGGRTIESDGTGQVEINEAMTHTRKELLENFDDEVRKSFASAMKNLNLV